MTINNNEELDAVIERMIALNRLPGATESKELAELADAAEAYELVQGHVPAPPTGA